MDEVLSRSSLEEFKENGFVRTGITLSPSTIDAIHQLFQSPRVEGSPWSAFLIHDPQVPYGTAGPAAGGTHAAGFARRLRNWTIRNLASVAWKCVPSLMYRLVKRSIQRNIYVRSVFGTSRVLETVLDECMAQGLGRHFTKHRLLVAHDIFLENRSDQSTFGFHEDGWSMEMFYQTEDDLTLFVQLRDSSESTGGRLKVEHGFHGSPRFRDRHRMTRQVSDICEKMGCIDDEGYASRESARDCEAVMDEVRRLRAERREAPRPDPRDLRPIDAQAGEVVIFANKWFHDIEPWAPHNLVNRTVYIVRLTPVYDFKLRPPTEFLGGAACNRFALEDGRVVPIDVESNPLLGHAIPVP